MGRADCHWRDPTVMYDHRITLKVACVPFVRLHQLIKCEVRNSKSFGTHKEADEEQHAVAVIWSWSCLLLQEHLLQDGHGAHARIRTC